MGDGALGDGIRGYISRKAVYGLLVTSNRLQRAVRTGLTGLGPWRLIALPRPRSRISRVRAKDEILSQARRDHDATQFTRVEGAHIALVFAVS